MGYVVIVGGELHNKGAQAMTYTVVDKIKKKYPHKEIVLFASVYTDKDENEKGELSFQVFPWNIRMKMSILGFHYSKYVGVVELFKSVIRGPGITKEHLVKIKTVLNNTDLIIDVSGYALSSQRGFTASLSYLYNIIVAKKYNASMYLLPQSFGPFDYSEKQKKVLFPLMKEYLKYPKKIFARENEGVKYLKQLNLKNIEKSYDCVFQGDENFCFTNIYLKGINSSNNVEIYNNSVAIVPNGKIMEHGDSYKQYNLYNKLIELILSKGKKVYLIRHSYIDLNICRDIKKNFVENDNVVLLEDDFNCIQINNLLKEFDFLIASRYHSIVHAYKIGKPALVFGWATKYHELLSLFSQEKYLFDVRKSINTNLVLEKLEFLMNNSQRESDVITKTYNDLRNNQNIFKQIEIK